jgi:16S rRNA (cytidine1402-2'-O)-methyltransferase
MNKKSRREHLESLRREERTMIFHEAPHKLRATLGDLSAVFGPERRVALCREMTKLHEEVQRTTLGEAVCWYETAVPKGEYVLVVAGAEPERPAVSLDAGVERVLELRDDGVRMKDAVRQAASETGLSKNELYQAVLVRTDGGA